MSVQRTTRHHRRGICDNVAVGRRRVETTVAPTLRGSVCITPTIAGNKEMARATRTSGERTTPRCRLSANSMSAVHSRMPATVMARASAPPADLLMRACQAMARRVDSVVRSNKKGAKQAARAR